MEGDIENNIPVAKDIVEIENNQICAIHVVPYSNTFHPIYVIDVDPPITGESTEEKQMENNNDHNDQVVIYGHRQTSILKKCISTTEICCNCMKYLIITGMILLVVLGIYFNSIVHS